MRGNIETSQDLFPGADMFPQQWAKEMDNRVKRQPVASVTTAADDTEPEDEPVHPVGWNPYVTGVGNLAMSLGSAQGRSVSIRGSPRSIKKV